MGALCSMLGARRIKKRYLYLQFFFCAPCDCKIHNFPLQPSANYSYSPSCPKNKLASLAHMPAKDGWGPGGGVQSQGGGAKGNEM